MPTRYVYTVCPHGMPIDRIKEDEPYRYECPKCGSERIEDKRRRIIEDSAERMKKRKVYEELYYCNGCRTKLSYVIDKKREMKRE